MAEEVRLARTRRVDDTEPAAAWFGVGLALLVGSAVRLLPIAGADFPLNDGGLFATMIEDLVRNTLLLPASTTYNGLDIPFAYPPLGLYVAAVINEAFGVRVLDLLRYLPLAFSLASVPAIYWLASAVLGSRSGGVLAALSFALLPRAYLWMITGGGVTRALGFLLAIVALGIAWRLLRSPVHRWWTAIMLGLVGGLTVLAHPQAGVFMTVGIIAFLPWAHGWRTAAVRVLAAGVIGLIVVLPWVAAVAGHHGLKPLLSAVGSGGGTTEGVFNLLSLRFTEMAFLDVIGVAGLIGAALAIRRREFLLPLWLVVIVLVDSRAGSTFSMVAISMLAAYFLLSLSPRWLPRAGSNPLRSVAVHPWQTAGTIGLLFVLVVGNYLSGLGRSSPLFPLSQDQREALAWVDDNAGEGDTFAVITGNGRWENDAVSEWFPALTNERSVGTVQGYEWLGAEAWQRQQDVFDDLQHCARDVLPCVVARADEYHIPVTHVFLPKGQLHGPLSDLDCCPAPRHSVQLVPGARVIYDGPGATVIELP